MIVKNPVSDAAVAVMTREHPKWKRALDLSLTMVLLPVLAPLLGLIALYIRCVSHGPVFFVQSRYNT